MYTLNYHSNAGLWMLKLANCRARFYASRYGAERVIARYRRMLKSACAPGAARAAECKHCDKPAEWKWSNGQEHSYICSRCMATLDCYSHEPIRRFVPTSFTVAKLPELLPAIQTAPGGGGTVRDSDVMATINRDIDKRIGLPNAWTGADRRGE